MGGSTQIFDWIFFGIMVPPVLFAAWDMFRTGAGKVTYVAGAERPLKRGAQPVVVPEAGMSPRP